MVVRFTERPSPALAGPAPRCRVQPRGSWKYPLIDSLTRLVAFILHSTMSSAISAVTKSAYATFHAPPLWRPVRRREGRTRGRASGGFGGAMGSLGLRGLGRGWDFGLAPDRRLHLDKRRAQFHGNRAPRVLQRQKRDEPRAKETIAVRSTCWNCASVSLI